MSKLVGSLILVGVAVAAALVAITLAFQRDMAQAHARIQGRSELLDTPQGQIEFTQSGTGPAVLVVHGSGGGFDQGELLARAALGPEAARHRVITPSRFGYLRSTFRSGATFEDQAQAYVHLLDHLGIDRVAVIAFSHGGPSALLLAARHPQRVSSLTLLSAGVASSAAPAQREADARGDALMRIYRHDVFYWALTTFLRTRFLELMGADAAVAARLTPEQRQSVDDLIDVMNPVAPRAAGAAFDNGAAMPNERIAAIRAPTLIVHARDDRLQQFHNAEFAHRTIAGSQLVAFERGGHLVLAVEQARIRALVAQQLGADPAQ